MALVADRSFRRNLGTGKSLSFVRKGIEQFLTIYRQAPPDDQAKLRQIWEEAGLGALPEDGNPP